MKKAIITSGCRKGEKGKKLGTREHRNSDYYIIQLDDPFRKVPLYVHESRVKFLDSNNTND